MSSDVICRREGGTNSGRPLKYDVSAVVPCRNEVETIVSCLQSIRDQRGVSFEIIVVDGMSDDGTWNLLQRIAAEDSRVNVLRNPKRITPAAMNLGVLEAKGRYVAIMGAHSDYEAEYLAEAVAFLDQHHEYENVGGVLTAVGTGYFQRAFAAAFHHPFGSGGARWHCEHYEGEVDTVFGGVYRATVFERIGLFDEELVRNQDDELNLRLSRAGGKIWQTKRMRSNYQPRNSLRKIFAQYRQWGYWKLRVLKKHKIPASVRHVVPGLFVLVVTLLPIVAGAGLFLAPEQQALTIGSVVFWALVVGSYFTVAVMSSVQAGFRSTPSLIPVLPLVFACMHFGYGFGFLEGVLAALSRKSGDDNKSRITR